MGQFSRLAGPLQKLPHHRRNYTVGFTNVISYDRFFYRVWTRLIAGGALILVVSLGLILFKPSHWIVFQQPHSSTHLENWIMLICLATLQVLLVIGTFSVARSTIKSKDPIPVRPPNGLRIAFVTTRAPGEPVAMVQSTLQAIKQVRYNNGTVDVWLLDETDDEELKAICNELSIKHFSRKGVPNWNTAKSQKIFSGWAVPRFVDAFTIRKLPVSKPEPHTDPFMAAQSKHGNFNSWADYLKKQDISYDLLAGVDTDHIPEANYLERFLGYFRDPDVAYVVGPQVYGNYGQGSKSLIARWAESQASFFQSTVQRAGNASTSAMFVGTNYVVRMAALDQVGGFQPYITEDMATGLAIHAKRNPKTKNKWKSVYTPDVVAVGKGPDFWGPYFSQQWRWAAGSFDTWRRMVWRMFFRLPPKVMLHYFLILPYYPMTALAWLLGIISSMIYLTTGATAILAPWGQFAALYMMTAVMQLSLYFWNRRYNVSPHEPEGSYGVPGMLLSILTAPIYFSALVGILFGKKPHFVVTKKGDAVNPDRFSTFRTHLLWALVLIFGIAYGFTRHHTHPAMLLWASAQLLICLTPVVLGMSLALPNHMRKDNKTFSKRLVHAGKPHNA